MTEEWIMVLSKKPQQQTFGLDEDSSVADFMNRFSDPNTYVPPEEANTHFENLLQRRPPEFERATGTILSQMDENHLRNAASRMDGSTRAGFAGKLLKSLLTGGAVGGGGLAGGLDLGKLAQMIGLRNTDPSQMDEDDLGRLTTYAQRNNPAALQNAAREEPGFIKALGNPMVAGALAVMGAALLSKMRGGR
jgi:hypothetical protein